MKDIKAVEVGDVVRLKKVIPVVVLGEVLLWEWTLGSGV